MLPTAGKNRKGIVSCIRKICECAAAATVKPISPASPGSVQEYSHHVLLRLPRPETTNAQQDEIWWPARLERHPAIHAAYAALAQHRESIVGLVKVTAFESWPEENEFATPDASDVIVYPDGIRYDEVRGQDITDIVSHHVTQAQVAEPNVVGYDVQEVAVFICTHGQRDSRCGVHGPEIAKIFQDIVEEMGVERLKIFQVSHVGGHKFAGNVLVYGGMSPSDGDWFGGVTRENAADFIKALVQTPVSKNGGAEDPALRPFWRGRMGLTKEEQLELFNNPTAHLEESDDVSDDVSDEYSDDSAEGNVRETSSSSSSGSSSD